MTDSMTLNRWLPLALLIAAIGPLGTAYTAELGFGYEPCVLCLYQRVPYGVIIVLGIAAMFLQGAEARRWIVLAAAATFLAGAGIAFYHVGVEQLWWASAAPCGSSGEAVTTTQDLFAALQKKPVKSCGDIDWTLFGISMATYNVGVSLFFAAASLWTWRRLNGADAA
jgi:disulfide bond formation protein DsbB